MTLRNTLLTTCLCVSAILFSGCAGLLVAGGAAAGVGSYAYVTGELKSIEEVNLQTVWDAATQASSSMGFVAMDARKGDLTAELDARGPGDRALKIKMKKIATNVVELRIRVGLVGDRALSEHILKKIRANY